MKEMTLRLVMAAVVAVAVAGCGGDGDRQFPQQISQLNEQFEQAFQNRDATKLAEVYATDAKLMAANTLIIEGRDAIGRFWADILNAGYRELNLETTTVERREDIAVELGRYSMASPQGRTDRGKYVVVWKQVDGQWKLWVDAFSSDLPPEPPPAPEGQRQIPATDAPPREGQQPPPPTQKPQ